MVFVLFVNTVLLLYYLNGRLFRCASNAVNEKWKKRKQRAKMTNRNYNNGRAFEYRVRDHFKAQGYEVFRMAGSHSPADLICLKGVPYFPYTRTDVKLVQCKGKKELMTKQQKQDFFIYCYNVGAEGILAYSHKRKLVLENALCATSAKQELSAPIVANPVS
jgi:hypothetical protein